MKGTPELLHESSRQTEQRNREPQSLKTRWFFRCVAVSMAVARIVAARNTIGPDPRAYMELARAILRHDWAMVPNAYWSALYPWLLAAASWVFKPSLRQEFPLAHALALPTYLVCIASFEFFWTTLLQFRDVSAERRGLSGTVIPAAQMWVLGYSLFLWMTIGGLILLINPDVCVTAVALAAAGLLIRIRNVPDATKSLHLWFGICLGLGYLTKAILFPMAFVFLGMMILVSGHPFQRRSLCFAIATVAFLALATPQVVLISRAKGHFTFSDTGKISLAWLNYHLPYRNWQGEPPGSGRPAHPTRKVYEHPAVYEFNGPLRASYPPWFDPSYWNEGLSPAFSLGKTAQHAIHELLKLGLELLHPTAWVVGMLLIFLGSDPKKTWRGIAVYWYLLVISATAFSLYCLTLIESRYLVPWEILCWGALLAGVRLRKPNAPLYRWLTIAVSLALIGAMLKLTYAGFIHPFPSDATPEYKTAEGLLRMGVRPGTKVGAIGFDNDAYWAYLARVDIVAEINTDETCLFWSEPPQIQNQVLEKFRQAGASVVVANTGGGVKTTSRAVPYNLAECSRPVASWKNIEDSANQAYFLK